MPRANPAVPLSFWRREKNARVFSNPIISVRPIRKRIWFVGSFVRYMHGGHGLCEGLDWAYVSHCESIEAG